MNEKIGIVICNYNKQDYIVPCIQSVLDSSMQDFAVYVVDNASTDESVSCIKKQFGDRVMLLENQENLGGSGGFNTGLREALKHGHSYIMLMDNDIIADRKAVEELYHFLEQHPKVGVVGSKVCFMDEPDHIWGYGGMIDFTEFKQKDSYKNFTDGDSIPEVAYCEYVAACSLMARTEVIEKVGLMPEDNFIYWDDMEWGWRINQAGYQVAVCGKSKIWHKAGGRNAGNTFIHYYMWRNRIHFFMNTLMDEQKERFADSILSEMFRMIYSVYLKGETNIVRTLMYAFDDAVHGVRGKASEEKILNRPVVPNRVKEAMTSCDSVLIRFNGNYEGLDNIIRNLRGFKKDLRIAISPEVTDTIGVTQKTLLAQYPDCEFCVEYRPEKYDKHMIMCEHIFNLPDDAKEDVYIDPWCNIIYSPEDFIYCKSFKQTKELFLLCKKDMLLSMKNSVKPLVIFGAGSGAVKVIRTMKCLGVEIQALTDNSPSKWGTICEDLPIIRPEELKNMDCNIMIASTYQEEIEEQLKEYGVFEHVVLKEQFIKAYIESHLNDFSYLEKMDREVNTSQAQTVIIGLEEGMWLGGVENLAFMWARELKKRGMTVWIFSKETEDLPPEDLKENVRYFNLDYKRYWASIKDLTQALSENLPCYVIDNWENQLLEAVSIIKRYCPKAIRCISFIHNDQYLFYRRTAFMEKYIDAIAGVSKDVVAHLENEFGIDKNKLFYKESPIEFEKDLIKTYEEDSKNPLRIGYAARITKTQKRADLLVPLIERLNQLKVNYRLSIAGIGDYYERLQTEIAQKGLSETVILHGWIDRSDMKEFWKEKDVFFNLSDYEGVGLSMLEAMSYSVVPIVTDVAGAREFITEENGFICECGDVEAIAEHIKELDIHRERLSIMGENARRVVRTKCNKEDYIDYILALFGGTENEGD